MKRFLVFLLVLTMGVVTVATAEGADIDLSGKTVDELIAIQKAVSDAIYDQGGKVVLPQGELLVGRDIAPGSYILEPHNANKDFAGWAYSLWIWKTATSKADYEAAEIERKNLYWEAERDRKAGKEANFPPFSTDLTQFVVLHDDSFKNTDVQRITLEEGQVLEYSTSTSDPTLVLTIEKAAGLFMD